MDNSADFRWWEQVELTKLILATNKLTQITKDIKHLSNLTSLDIHDNQLQSIDDAVGELNLLQNLNLSHNQLTTLPNNICELRRLTHFNLSLFEASFSSLNEIDLSLFFLDASN